MKNSYLLDGHSQSVGADLRHSRLVALAKRREPYVDRDAVSASHLYPGTFERATAGILDITSNPYPVILSFFVPSLTLPELSIADFFQRSLEGHRIVAAIKDCGTFPTTSHAEHVRHFRWLNQVLQAKLGRGYIEISGPQAQQTLPDKAGLIASRRSESSEPGLIGHYTVDGAFESWNPGGAWQQR